MPSSALTTPTETTFSTAITETASVSSGYVSNASSLSSMSSVVPSINEVTSIGSAGFPSCGSQSSTNVTLVPAPTLSSEKKDGKGAAKTGKKERLPRIQLKRIEGSPEGPVVECSFDTYKNNRITFKFGIDDDEPDEVSANMVSHLIKIYKE